MKRREDEGQDTLKIERSLGFWWPRGISRQRGRCKVTAVKTLLDEIAPVIRQYSTMLPADIYASKNLQVEANRIFDATGPDLWPDPSVDRSGWVATDVNMQILEGLYPRHLYFSRPLDQAEYAWAVPKSSDEADCICRLRDHFRELLARKCVNRYWNTLQAGAKARHFPTVTLCEPAQAIATSSLCPATSDSDEDWEPYDDTAVSRQQRAVLAAVLRSRGRRPFSPCSPPAEPSRVSSQDEDCQRTSDAFNVLSKDNRKRHPSNGSIMTTTTKKMKAGSGKDSICHGSASLTVVLRLAPVRLAVMEAGGVMRNEGMIPDVPEEQLLRQVEGDDGVDQPSLMPKTVVPRKQVKSSSTACSNFHECPEQSRPCPIDALSPLGTIPDDLFPSSEHHQARLLSNDPDFGHFIKGPNRADDCGVEPARPEGPSINPPRHTQSLSVHGLPCHQNVRSAPPTITRFGSRADVCVVEHPETRAVVVPAEEERPSCHTIPTSIFGDIQVEIDWNRNVSTPDYMILEDCHTVDGFFKLLEDQLPPELEAYREKIMQVKVKAVDSLADGPKFDCRIRRSVLGWAALKQMLRKLKLRPKGKPLEMIIHVDWSE